MGVVVVVSVGVVVVSVSVVGGAVVVVVAGVVSVVVVVVDVPCVAYVAGLYRTSTSSVESTAFRQRFLALSPDSLSHARYSWSCTEV